MAKHMDDKDRGRIEYLLDCGKTITQIAKDLGRPESTVSREIQNRRIDSEKRFGCTNRLCSRFDECELTQFDGFSTRLRKNSARCFDRCPRFFEAGCERWAKAPYVCNGCEREPHCPLRKKYYRAAGAQANYEGTLHASRLGVHVDAKTFEELDRVVSLGVKKGQSVRHIVASNPELFDGISPRTVYDWIHGNLLLAKKHDLPFACGRRARPKKMETKTNAKCRIGRTIQEMREWLKENPGVVPCEVDTVIGSISGKVLFTMIFPDTGLALAFLRDAKTSQTCTRIFNMLWELAGPDLFRALFAAILGDNGVEFSDPGMIENYRPDPEHNPTKLLPRGVRFWYADPYCSTHKPHIERVHEDIRRVLMKGTSFNALDQDGINLVMSHVNSMHKPSLGDRTPYDVFIEKHGESGRRLLEALGIRKVPGNQVTLHPFLLGQKFQRHADKVTLWKNGVTNGKKPVPESKKPGSDK
ncbi:helix-turn-helix domain-containing protein [Alistipes shahii]|uniref:helix-turn-helix domain-containing protein n=1 Tax=Alistipes shahii TaxID=328814 RepID=UPI00241DA4E8|nr:helix-turn-helix domain-containing protein [Alistipes shahii]